MKFGPVFTKKLGNSYEAWKAYNNQILDSWETKSKIGQIKLIHHHYWAKMIENWKRKIGIQMDKKLVQPILKPRNACGNDSIVGDQGNFIKVP